MAEAPRRQTVQVGEKKATTRVPSEAVRNRCWKSASSKRVRGGCPAGVLPGTKRKYAAVAASAAITAAVMMSWRFIARVESVRQKAGDSLWKQKHEQHDSRG